MPVKLHYNLFGEGPPVIILHGLFGSSRNWQSVAKALSDTHQIITVDLRNHGLSAHTASMSYQDMAGDIHALIRQLSLDDVSLVGHSMGGKAAMMLALSSPEMVSKLAVLDIAPVSYEHRYGKIFHVLQNLPLDMIKNRNEAAKILNNQLEDDFLTQFLLQNLIKDENSFIWRLNIPSLLNNIDLIGGFPEVGSDARYHQPALFLGGRNSHFIQPEHHPVIQSYFPNADIALIDNAGHMLHIEQPVIVIDKLRKFITT